MTASNASLLPAHLSELERELDAALARIDFVDIQIATLWDPFNCKIESLPFLAWALSVDQWDSGWPEKIKRQVVAESMHVHRIKGTRPAVEVALKALGIDVDIEEWFEQEPRATPGTFRLTAWINENLSTGDTVFLTEHLYQQVREAVNCAKNERSHFDFQLGARFKSQTIGAASAMTGTGSVVHVESCAQQEPLSSARSIGVAPISSCIASSKQELRATIDASPTRACALKTANALSCVAVIYQKMEAI